MGYTYVSGVARKCKKRIILELDYFIRIFMNWTPKTFINLGFLLRAINSFYNGFMGTSLGAGADSISFHYRASNPWYNPDKHELFRVEGILIDGAYVYIKFLQIYMILL